MKTNGQTLFESTPQAAQQSWDSLPASAKFDYEQAAVSIADTCVKARTSDLQVKLETSAAVVKKLEESSLATEALLTQRTVELAAKTSECEQLKGQVALLQQQLAAAQAPAPSAPAA